MSILTWLIVGLIAGCLAGKVMRGKGYGVIGDIVVGLIGAVLGGWIFDTLNIEVKLRPILGEIIVAFIGAVVLVAILRAVKKA
ncbi:MAG: GlsB/YeaQ/YmgE family stress response membrane protein [bacterium]